jgi:hypothetical protein
MVDTLVVIAGALANVHPGSMEALNMSSRRKTVPSTRRLSPPSSSGREELIAKEKTKKQSAKMRTALDDHFYRTDLRFSGAALHTAG